MSNITIEGKKYELDSLSETTRRLVAVHSKWTQELEEVRMEMAKLEAALRDLSREIVESVKDMPEEKSDE